MDIADTKVSLRNPRKPELAPVEVEALADFCAVHLCIPEHIRIQLKLDEIDKKEATLADGTKSLFRMWALLSFVSRIVLVSPRPRRGDHG